MKEDKPVSFKEVIHNGNSESWLAMMEEQMQPFRNNQTWEVVPFPVGKKDKKMEDPFKLEDIRYKARLVAKGFTQREGVYYNEFFSPVMKHTFIRVLLSIVAHGD